MIPPKHNAEFVAQMEDVLDIYQRPYTPESPVVCMDEQPTQLIRETHPKLPAEPGKPERRDFEYERNGTVTSFMFTETLAGWRKVKIRKQRTAIDWAHEIQELLDVDYPDAKLVVLICDNLNTHCVASLYKTFPPEEARRLVKRLEIHHTPKHGSWLNVAEIELSAFTRQCLNRRLPTEEILRRESKTWFTKRNEKQKSVDWHFTAKDARIKLKHLYPQIKA